MVQKTYDRHTAKFLAVIGENMPILKSHAMQGWIENPKALQQVLVQALCPPTEPAEVKPGDFDPATFISKGWTIAEDRESLPENWDSSKTVLESALKSGENYATGEEWLKRLADKPLLGTKAFWFYWNNKKQIPKEWKGKYVFFDATVLLGPHGHRCSLYLYWNDGAWYWYCHWLGHNRDAGYVSASLAS